MSFDKPTRDSSGSHCSSYEPPGVCDWPRPGISKVIRHTQTETAAAATALRTRPRVCATGRGQGRETPFDEPKQSAQLLLPLFARALFLQPQMEPPGSPLE